MATSSASIARPQNIPSREGTCLQLSPAPPLHSWARISIATSAQLEPSSAIHIRLECRCALLPKNTGASHALRGRGHCAKTSTDSSPANAIQVGSERRDEACDCMLRVTAFFLVDSGRARSPPSPLTAAHDGTLQEIARSPLGWKRLGVRIALQTAHGRVLWKGLILMV